MIGLLVAYNARYQPPISITADAPATWVLVSLRYTIGTTTVFANYGGTIGTTLFLQHQLNTYQTVAITIMSILAPRLLINIRREYYDDGHEDETELSWNAEGPDGSVNASSGSVGRDSNLIDFGGEFNGDDIPLSVLEHGSVVGSRMMV